MDRAPPSALGRWGEFRNQRFQLHPQLVADFASCHIADDTTSATSCLGYVSGSKKTVQVTFSGTKAGDGMLALTSESGAAKNVAIQLYQDGKALKLDTTSASVKLKTGDNDIPFAAQYTSNGGTPVAGKANAIAQFTLSYP
ncbi:fimbrial protein [Burkholderia glumae]